jgi:septal ring factor EnvC (AmiA/AmiB activator)
MNLNEMNEEIMLTEKTILEKQRKLSEQRKSLEMLRLEVNNTLDSTNKDYSNQQKRDIIIDKNLEVIKISEEIKKLDYEVRVLEIENRHKLRNFEILIKSELI